MTATQPHPTTTHAGSATRIASWNVTAVSAGAHRVGIAAAMWLLPPLDQTLERFPG